jgi:hypothetical protein
LRAHRLPSGSILLIYFSRSFERPESTRRTLLYPSTRTIGRASPSFLSKPKNRPTSPEGFGIGHSLCEPGELSPGTSSPVVRILRFLFPSVTPGMSPSANARDLRSTGQGRMCGKATTTNDMARVVVKRESVWRERGCSAGGMAR